MNEEKNHEIDKEKSIRLLIKELFVQIDEIASLQKKGFKANLSKFLFAETCSVLKDVDPETLELFHEKLIDLSIEKENTTPHYSSEEEIKEVTEKRKKLISTIRQELAA